MTLYIAILVIVFNIFLAALLKYRWLNFVDPEKSTKNAFVLSVILSAVCFFVYFIVNGILSPILGNFPALIFAILVGALIYIKIIKEHAGLKSLTYTYSIYFVLASSITAYLLDYQNKFTVTAWDGFNNITSDGLFVVLTIIIILQTIMIGIILNETKKRAI